MKGFCNTKGVKDHRQVLTEKLLITPTLEECQMECLSGGVVNVGFVCRSFTYEPSSRTCSLSHHSTKSSHLVKSTSHVYFEVSSCFEGKRVRDTQTHISFAFFAVFAILCVEQTMFFLLFYPKKESFFHSFPPCLFFPSSRLGPLISPLFPPSPPLFSLSLFH